MKKKLHRFERDSPCTRDKKKTRGRSYGNWKKKEKREGKGKRRGGGEKKKKEEKSDGSSAT